MEEIGLTRSEGLVYLALAELGPSSTGKIIEKSGVASSKIYEILNKLELKGLVSHVIKTGVKEFGAAPPERIIDYLNEKEREIKKEKQKAERFVSMLKTKIIMSKGIQEATIYRGLKGLRTVFYDCLNNMKTGDEWCAMSVPARSPEVNRFFIRWGKARAKKGVKFKMMVNEQAKNDPANVPENMLLSEIRVMPEYIIAPAAVNICNDRVVIFPAESGEDPLLIMIKSKSVADSFRVQFDLLWQQNVRTFYGLDGPRFVLNELINNRDLNFAFGLTKDKFKKHVPHELNKLVEMQNERKIKPPHLIFTGETTPHEISKYTKFKVLPKKFSTPFHYEVYGNKVAIFYWINPIITTVIENKIVADNFRQHFNEMWKIAREN